MINIYEQNKFLRTEIIGIYFLINYLRLFSLHFPQPLNKWMLLFESYFNLENNYDHKTNLSIIIVLTKIA